MATVPRTPVMSDGAASVPNALLTARNARLAVDGVTSIDGLTLCSFGDRVVVVGDATALMGALTCVPLGARPRRDGSGEPEEAIGEVYVAGGALEVAGANVAEKSHLRLAGVAPLDPPLPSGYTPVEYVACGARLGGANRRGARDLAERVLADVGMHLAKGRALSSLAKPERRALVLAQAIVGSPAVLIAEAPLSALEGAAADFVRCALEVASRGRRLLASVKCLSPSASEADLARTASYAAVLRGGQLVLEGAPSDVLLSNRAYTVTVPVNADLFRTALASVGADIRGGPTRFGVLLPRALSPIDILRAASSARAPILELVALVG
jgi:ABC-2 type transport system ATP-binding protein